MAGAYPSARGRKRAVELKALDARELLHSTLPFVLQRMPKEQVGHVQKVRDAAVVNPAIEKQVAKLMRRSLAVPDDARRPFTLPLLLGDVKT
jgi:hypothetical protein